MEIRNHILIVNWVLLNHSVSRYGRDSWKCRKLPVVLFVNKAQKIFDRISTMYRAPFTCGFFLSIFYRIIIIYPFLKINSLSGKADIYASFLSNSVLYLRPLPYYFSYLHADVYLLLFTCIKAPEVLMMMAIFMSHSFRK